MSVLTEKKQKGLGLTAARKETRDALNQSSGKSIFAAQKFKI